jgi:hypothetical protein
MRPGRLLAIGFRARRNGINAVLFDVGKLLLPVQDLLLRIGAEPFYAGNSLSSKPAKA